MDEPEDPNNVKPVPQNIGEIAKQENVKDTNNLVRETSKSKSKVQLDRIKKERAPSFTNTPAFISQPLLKLNHYSKNCSQPDSLDDPCEFVHPKWNYSSQQASSCSMSNEPKNNYGKAVAPPKTIHRPDLPKIINHSKCKVEHAKSKEKKKDDETNKSKGLKVGSGIKKNSPDKLKKEKESNSKGSKKCNKAGSGKKEKGKETKSHTKANKPNQTTGKSKDKDKDSGNKKKNK